MPSTQKIPEKQFHKIWQTQDFTEELKTSSGELLTVLNPGDYNTDESGPDFKNARIKIGNLTFIGDVEIDQDYSDWKKHGHNINRNYNKIILHICYSNLQKQHYIYTSDGRRVPSIAIDKIIASDNIELVEKKITKVREEPTLKCASEIHLLEKDIRINAILKYGITRLEKKSNKIFTRLKELKFLSELEIKEPVIRYELTKEFNEKKFSQEDFKDKDIWKQLLYELIFEALGYSKNKGIMLKLSQFANISFLCGIEYDINYRKKLETTFYRISGLLPEKEDSNDEYINNLWEEWDNLSKKYDGRILDETQWHFLGQRPQNFPTVRIAGGIALIEAILHHNLAGKIINKFSEINSSKVLINSIRSLFIIKANGYWKNHYIFNKPSNISLNYFIGLSRADEIVINIVLPFLSVYFELFGNEKLSKKVIKIYNEYDQKSDNKIIRQVVKGLQVEGIEKKAIYAQGMIEVYNNYCSKGRCLECELGKQIFS